MAIADVNLDLLNDEEKKTLLKLGKAIKNRKYIRRYQKTEKYKNARERYFIRVGLKAAEQMENGKVE